MSSFRMLAAAAALSVLGPAGLSAQSAPPAAPAVTVVQAAERELTEQTIVTGTLVPRHEILVSPEIEGFRIAEVLAEEGDLVEKGQVLARLTRDVLETQLAQNDAQRARAEAGVAQARSQIVQAEAAHFEAQQALERARALMKSGNTTEAVLEQRIAAARTAEGRLSAARDGLRMAEAERTAAEAQRREIEWRLSRTEVRTPAAGIVSRKTARVGATASAAGEPLFRIIAQGEIELEGEVPETEMPRLKEGASAEVRVTAQEVVTGRVRNLFPEVDRATRLGKVRIALPKHPALRIGAFAQGTIEVARSTGVAVPTSAVLYAPEGPRVMAVVNDRVELRRVRTGLAAGSFVEIVEGLKAGEWVVARAGSFLRDGDIVRPVPAGEKSRTAQSEGVR